MTTPLAHAAHWYHTILYIAPVVLIAVGLWWSGRHAQRERSERERPEREAKHQD